MLFINNTETFTASLTQSGKSMHASSLLRISMNCCRPPYPASQQGIHVLIYKKIRNLICLPIDRSFGRSAFLSLSLSLSTTLCRPMGRWCSSSTPTTTSTSIRLSLSSTA
jgi:hypothetical protein